MTFKQSIAVILVSAATSVGSIWGYGKLREQVKFAYDLPASSSIFGNAKYTESSANVPM